MAAAERVFKLLDTEPEIQSPASSASRRVAGRIEFDDVWFAYRHVEAERSARSERRRSRSLARLAGWEWVLRGVSFTIEPGETVAIVGHTGAGKTTLICLLLRFYDVQKGAVRIDGVDVREMNLQKLRRRCGVVLQDPFLFSGHHWQQHPAGLGACDATRRWSAAAEEVNVAGLHPLAAGGVR